MSITSRIVFGLKKNYFAMDFLPFKNRMFTTCKYELKNVVQTSKSWLKTRQTWKLLIAKK